jgi:hypothetical protein
VATPPDRRRLHLAVPADEAERWIELAVANSRTLTAEIRLAMDARLKDFDRDERKAAA